MTIAKDARIVLETLEKAGFEAFLVGGCVRDTLLGLSPKDYDVCTNASPGQMLSVFGGFSVYETGIKHGTLSVRSGEMLVEVTSYRVDGAYSDNRRPDSVTFVGELREDLARRDFTINAMACDKNGVVSDFFGGRAALENKIICCVGDGRARFEEDSLRILRGLRFASALGFDIQGATAGAMREKKRLLRNVSAERIREELTKLLCGGAAGNVLREYSDIFFEVLPEIGAMRGFAQNHPPHGLDVWGHTLKVVGSIPPAPALRWAALLHDSGKPRCYTEESGRGHLYCKISAEIADAILSRLRFDNKTKDKILSLIRRHGDQLPPDGAFIKRGLGKAGEDGLRELLLLVRADTAGHGGLCAESRARELDRFEAELERIIASRQCFTLKQLALNGNDLMKAGFESGKEIGAALKLLLEAVIDGKCDNDKYGLLRYLEKTLKRKLL